ncbi:MAG TPA: nuclear transport factor 2 family protein [Xanthomonadales bacterium]|nr:nuclear transport factor 2 family protein [Xanthomonadales bacterium]
MMEYLDVLERCRRQLPLAFERGSVAESDALARFARFFSDFSPDKVERLVDQTYAADVWFNDTLKTLHGRDALRSYLKHSAQAVQSCRVEILDTLSNDRGDYYVRWTMVIRFKRFKPGEDTQTIGMSHLRFDRDGLVRLHQDYWDSSAGLFEHIPLLGAAIRAIKRRV